MASFKAVNVFFRGEMTLEGFEPSSVGRMHHPTLRGRAARRAYQRAWKAATLAAAAAGLGYSECDEWGQYSNYPFATPRKRR